jgi:hypothetical protein
MMGRTRSRGMRAGDAMDRFDVYVLRFDVNEERATRGLMQVFGLSEAAARIFVHSVPRVGKRNVSTDTAERYVRALHAIGAGVECRRTNPAGAAPTADGANRGPQPMSLPAPTTSKYPGASSPPHIMQDSLGIMAPLAFSPDMPQIPKAPRIPADLHAIRQRKGPDSLAPNWRHAGDPAPNPSRASGKGSAGQGTFNSNAPSDNDGLWNPNSEGLQTSSDPLAKLESPFRGRGAAAETAQGEARDPARAARELEQLLASPTPLSPSPFAPSGPVVEDAPTPWYASTTNQLVLACLMIGGMVVALSTGMFETDAKRLARAFQHAGVQAGAFEPAEQFVSRPGSQFDSMPPEALRGVLDRLAKAGAAGIWVSDIQQSGQSRTSHTLLVELPKQPAPRRLVLAELARAKPPPADAGQCFVRVVF